MCQCVFEICIKLIVEYGFVGMSICMMVIVLDVFFVLFFNLFGFKDGLLNELILYVVQVLFFFYDELKVVEVDLEVLLYKSIYEEVIVVVLVD